MATYVLPQVLVFQDFTISPTAAANPLSAHIAGGHAYLTRTTDTDEKENGFLAYYDFDDTSQVFSWPSRPAGSIVDTTYTTVYIENALLQYYTKPLGQGDTIYKAANYHNRIKSSSTNFATNGVFARDPLFIDRDVKKGDQVRVRATTSGDPVILWTTVKDLIANVISAEVDGAGTDSGNAPNGTAGVTITKESGAENCVTMTNGTGNTTSTDYDGITDGYPLETYTIRVIEPSTGNDYTTARLRVTSASGTDDVDNVTPAAAGAETTIGTRGFTVIFSDDDTAACSASADGDDVSYNNLIGGQTWKAIVVQLWEKATAATTTGAIATYTSTASTVYLVTVTRGGRYTDTLVPQISVSTSNGTDQSGPHNVSNHTADVTIGTEGVVIQFSDNDATTGSAGLNKTDRYTVTVTGTTTGPVRTLELTDNISDTVANDGTHEVGLELYIRNPLLEVSEDRTDHAPTTNWQQTATQITLSGGILAYDSSWTDAGVPQELDVHGCPGCYYGKAYVTYRAWEVTHSNTIESIRDPANIDDISGSLTPDNPLKWGVYKALTNNNNTPVLYSAVTDPADADDWDEILELASGRDDVHAMVPLTRDPTVQGLYQGHVGSMSSETAGLWRTAWFNLQGVPEIPLVSTGSTVPGHTEATTSDGEDCLAVIEDDDIATGTQYTQVRNEAGNGKFITNGVLPGDIVRAIYDTDGFNNWTYQEFVVDFVQSEQQILLKVGPDQAYGTPAKIEIWRTLNLTQEATEIARDAGAFYDRRIMAIWPDTIESSGTIQEGFHLCAALAGLTSGVVPQQGLTRLGIAGFSDVQRTSRFSRAQLDVMALSGTWIVMQAQDGNIFTRQAITTGNYSDINQREEMLTRNIDSISYRFKDYFEPYIGVTNVTPSQEDTIRADINVLISVLQTERFVVNLGGQLIDADLVEFGIHPLFKDRYVAKLECLVPYALNNLEIHLIV